MFVYERPAGFGKERLLLRADRFCFGRLHNLSSFCTCMLCFSNCAELDSAVLLLEFVQVTLVFRLNVPKRYRKESLLKKTRDIKVLRVFAVLSFKLDKSCLVPRRLSFFRGTGARAKDLSPSRDPSHARSQFLVLLACLLLLCD